MSVKQSDPNCKTPWKCVQCGQTIPNGGRVHLTEDCSAK